MWPFTELQQVLSKDRLPILDADYLFKFDDLFRCVHPERLSTATPTDRHSSACYGNAIGPDLSSRFRCSVIESYVKEVAAVGRRML